MRPRAFHVGAQHLLERAPALGRRAVSIDTSVELMLERSKRDVGERVLATIVATAGSTYRKAGARMLLMADGNYSGLLRAVGALRRTSSLAPERCLRSAPPA